MEKDKALMVVITHHTEDCEDYTSVYPCSDEEQLERVFRLAIDEVKKYCADEEDGEKFEQLEGYRVEENEDYFQVCLCYSAFSVSVEKMRLPYDTTEISI